MLGDMLFAPPIGCQVDDFIITPIATPTTQAEMDYSDIAGYTRGVIENVFGKLPAAAACCCCCLGASPGVHHSCAAAACV